MPNHVTTRLKISGSPEEVRQFFDDCIVSDDDGRRALDFNRIVAMPEILRTTNSPNNNTEQGEAAKQETGFANWYDWSIENWGTKWNAYHFSEEPFLDGDDTYECVFDTAWSYPEPIFEVMERLYPTLKLEVVFFEECHNFAGHGQASDPVYCEPNDDLYAQVYGALPEDELEAENKISFEQQDELEME